MKKLITMAVIALAVFALVAVAGCSSSTPVATPAATPSTTSGSAAPAAGGTTVSIANFAFTPASVTVKVGDTVTWTNNDSVAHTVTGTSWDAGQVAPGASVTHTFTTAGSYDYKCTVHPSMAPGKVTVQ